MASLKIPSIKSETKQKERVCEPSPKMVSGVPPSACPMKAGHDAAVAQAHPRAVGVKDADDLRVHAVIAVIGHRHRFGETLGFIVNAARADRVHVAPVIFLLRMDERVAVAFRGGGQKERRLLGFGETERVMRAERADFQRRDRQLEIIDRARGRSEMENVIEFFFRQENEVRDVVLDEREILVAGEMLDVLEVAGDEIIDRDDAMTFRQQPVGQMRPEKTGPTGDD